MKTCIPIIALTLSLFSTVANAQKLYKNEPIILAKAERADIGIGKEWYNNGWRISPQVAHDTLTRKIYGKSESIAFRTDQDSIRFNIKVGETRSFYIKMSETEPAHTVISAVPYVWDNVTYNKKDKNNAIALFYPKASDLYFDSLRAQYPIGQLIKNDKNDMQKVLTILNWTHHQWKHDGGNAPKGDDGISILNEAKAGGRFPCFAYAIVLRDQLTAYGFDARVLYLKTKDAENRTSSPGHVVTEVYLKDQKKWVYVDGQFNVMPTLNGKPLNAVEFQQALSQHYDDVVLASRDEVSKRGYTEFVYDYLYYFDTILDNRLNLTSATRFKVDGKTNIMLVPVGAPNLAKINFWNSTLNYFVYTNSMADFYAQPK